MKRVLDMSKVKGRRTQSEVNDASAMLRWLNGDLNDSQAYLGKPTKASRLRVASLLREVNDTVAALVVMDEQNPDLDYFDFPEPQMEERVNRIQEMLNDYPRWPTVEVTFNNNAAILHFDYANGGRRPLGEQVAVWALTDLASKGRSNMVRQCGCERWYFARRGDQKACSPKCRHKNYEQTDEFKLKRRDYMREYYALKNSGKVR